MAEGCEETESNNSNAGTPAAMLGTVLPCEAITAALGGMKREFDAISGGPGGGGGNFSYSASSPASSPPTSQQKLQNQQPALFTSSTNDTSLTTITTTTTSSINNTTTTASATTLAATSLATKSPSSLSISSVSGNILQQHPINLKSEDEDIETNNHKSNSSSPPILLPDDKEFYKNLTNNNNNNSINSNRSLPENHENAKAAAVAAAHAHLNGTMQDMINLQKLQNLATLQQQQQHIHNTSVPAALASLQGLAGISSAVALNSPLNLSVGSASNLSSSLVNPKLSTNSGILGGGNNNDCNSPNSGSQMPQLILASGQLVQGVQGAQLLIPTAQGISVQTVLTIPVSQQINTNEQFLQNYSSALNSSGATVFNNMNLGGQIPSSSSQTNLLKPNLFSTGVQQLLAALHPQLFPPQQIQTGTNAEQSQQSTNHAKHIHMQQLHKQQLNNHHQNHHRDNDESLSPKLELQQSNCEPSPLSVHLRSSPSSRSPDLRQQQQQQQQQQQNQQLQQHSKDSPQHSIGFNLAVHDKSITTNQSLTSSTPPNCSNSYTSSGSGSQIFRSHSPNGQQQHQQQSSSSHSLSSQVVNPNSSCVLSNINRLSNGEVTITKSLGPPNHSISCGSTSSPSPRSIHQQQQQQQQQQHHHHSSHHQTSSLSMKMSPTSMQQQLSPPGTAESSTADLLIDSPNELTINQTNCNVVDGIDLDEIKEFAKAFKLRRLSLGLTQTQVGQALSVTEGPAYSQSAICSALAAQMYAAQLSSQQQNMFEKLDITPKSAQKIKPVLERWMKEAEESHWNRYKSGQNHLTDFIGVEPSKKRKRRTSFTPQALELLNAHFERNTHPSGTEITGMAHQLGYEREVIRIWFCNKRQALKNTVRMMSKGMV